MSRRSSPPFTIDIKYIIIIIYYYANLVSPQLVLSHSLPQTDESEQFVG
jgi:hypothetical protein